MSANFLNQVFGILTIIAQAVIVAVILLRFLAGSQAAIFSRLARAGLVLALLVAAAATLGSLLYSEVIGYEPCKLCWFQRIFMYPLVVLLGLAAWRKDRGAAVYGIVLAGAGGMIALYHYLLQLGLAPSLSCSAVGYSVSCAKVFVLQYGYISFPLMAATAFAFIVVMLSISLSSRKREKENLTTVSS